MAEWPYVLYIANVATNVRNESQEEGKSDRVDKVHKMTNVGENSKGGQIEKRIEERGDLKWMICVKEVEMITTTIASIPEETLHVTALQDVIPTTMMMMGTLGGRLL